MTDTPPDTLWQRRFDRNVRVDQIIHLPAMVDSDGMDEDFVEWLLEGGDHAPLRKALITFGLTEESVDAWLAKLDDMTSDVDAGFPTAELLREEIAQALVGRNVDMWLVKASVPFRLPRHRSYTWGVTESMVFVGRTYAQAVDAALAWAEEYLAAARASIPNDDDDGGDDSDDEDEVT